MYKNLRKTNKLFIQITNLNKTSFNFLYTAGYLLIFILLPNILLAQSFQASAVVDKNKALIGDYITLKLNVTCSASDSVSFPNFTDTLGQFDIIEAKTINSQVVGDQKAYEQKIIIAAYDSANITIPPLELIKNNIDKISTESISVLVQTVSVDTTKAIQPIAPIIQVPSGLSDYYGYIVAMLALILIGIIWYIKRKKKVVAPKVEEPLNPLTLKEKTLIKLKQLEEKKLWQQGNTKGYYTELSDVLREYIELRFELPALESTTEELAIEFKSKVKGYGKERIKLINLLTLSDLVKFAKVSPLPSEHETALAQAREWVSDTTPKVISPVLDNKIQEEGKHE